MDTLSQLRSIPIGSILTRPESEDAHILTLIKDLPPQIKKLITTESTGAFLRGLEKSHNLPTGSAPKIAYSILLISLGEKTLAQLPAILSSELKIPNDKAQKIATEIEKDLFAPIAAELNQHLKQKKQETPTNSPLAQLRRASSGEARGRTGQQNVLDLKDEKRRPSPPPIPGNRLS